MLNTDESHTRPNLGKGRAGCVVPDVTGRTLTQHNPVSNGGVLLCLYTCYGFQFARLHLSWMHVQVP